MPINPEAAGSVGEPAESSWTSKDSLLYALGVGAGVTDPTGFELEFTTENSNGIEQKALPTMAVVLGGGGVPLSAIGEFDMTMLVRNGDIVLCPKGYHGPTIALPGYHMYFLNAMAGPGTERIWQATDDPAHAWIKDNWDELGPDPRLPLTTHKGVV